MVISEDMLYNVITPFRPGWDYIRLNQVHIDLRQETTFHMHCIR